MMDLFEENINTLMGNAKITWKSTGDIPYSLAGNLNCHKETNDS